MPKIVDHEQRRAQIARAFQQQVADHGFAAASYAKVAAAAGVSVGLIQHYFENRQDLLEHAFDDLVRRRDARIDAVVAAGEARHHSIRRILDEALRELIPLDDDRRREHRVTQQLRLEAGQDKRLAALAEGAHRALHVRVRTAVGNGKTCGEVEPDVEPGVAATRILAASYGLAEILALTGGHPRLHDVFDPVVATVFTGVCHHQTPVPSPHP